MKKNLLKKSATVCMTLCLFSSLFSCIPADAPGREKSPIPSRENIGRVRTEIVEEHIERTAFRAFGTLIPHKEIAVFTQEEGRVTKITVREGDRVKEGDLLVTLDSEHLEEMLQKQYIHRNQAIKQSALYGNQIVRAEQKARAALLTLQSTLHRKEWMETEVKRREAFYEKQHRLYEAGAISREALQEGREEMENAFFRLQQVKDEIAVFTTEFTLETIDPEASPLIEMNNPEDEALLKEYMSLHTGGPKKQQEIAELAKAAADVEIRALERSIKNSSIHAPIGGIISRRLINNHEPAIPREPLFVIADTSLLKCSVNVAVKDLEFIKPGNTFSISNSETEGTVMSISPKIDPATGMGAVIIQFQNSDGRLKIGMFVSGEIDTQIERAAITVPAEAVIYSSETETAPEADNLKRAGVFVVRNNRLFSRSIIIEKQTSPNAPRITVSEGLLPGEEVVIRPGYKLTHGMEVEVLP